MKPGGQDGRWNSAKEAQDVEGILVPQSATSPLCSPVREFVQLRHQERARAGDTNLEAALIVRIERVNREDCVVHEGAFQAAYSSSRLVAMLTKSRSTATRTGHGIRHKEIDGHVRQDSLNQTRTQPDTRLNVQAESASLHRCIKPWIVLQECWVNNEVAIGRVLRNREVGITRVQVDRLGTGQNDRASLFTKGAKGVEQHLACGNVNWRDHAKSSTRGLDKY